MCSGGEFLQIFQFDELNHFSINLIACYYITITSLLLVASLLPFYSVLLQGPVTSVESKYIEKGSIELIQYDAKFTDKKFGVRMVLEPGTFRTTQARWRRPRQLRVLVMHRVKKTCQM